MAFLLSKRCQERGFVTIILAVLISVLSVAQKEVEDEINQQIWELPRELFRKHMQPAKFEVIVETYKGESKGLVLLI